MIVRNNPGNIRKSATFTWQGEKPTAVGDYITFDTLDNGFRAMIKDINTKIKSGTDTIQSIITKWAPVNDSNPTQAYISFVSQRTGIDPSQKIAANDYTTIGRVVTQMAVFESGLKDSDVPGVEYYVGKAKTMLTDVAQAIEKKKG